MRLLIRFLYKICGFVFRDLVKIMRKNKTSSSKKKMPYLLNISYSIVASRYSSSSFSSFFFFLSTRLSAATHSESIVTTDAMTPITKAKLHLLLLFLKIISPLENVFINNIT